ncbi:hypothetical protein BGW38_007737 [Lunasporangiospora selenospora]|uniref:DUF7082 domain-containing protein n=1 Tax=Lunasporangiospora selenospora TaxID=979761 RepID=A0A9P6K9X5_9FUNG|nr:hypothetical protein BGW38_007737 [Lunasporangiospora selenospora]
MPEPQQTQPLQQQMASFKQPLQTAPPKVLEYSPHFGPEGQPFTVTLQSTTDRSLRIGFGTLVVDTKQYSANGYITLSCTVPNFTITRWFVNRVPLYILQMENDMVMESWPFGDYTYYDDMQVNNKRANLDGNRMMYDQDFSQSPLSQKKQHLVSDLDLSQAQLAQSSQQMSPLAPSTPTSLSSLSSRNDYSIPTTAAYDSSLYAQAQQPSSPYGARSAMSTTPYARSSYYGANNMMAPHMPSYSQPELSASASHNGGYIHGHHAQSPVSPTPYMTQSPTHSNIGSNMALSNYNPYASLLNKANLKFTGNMDDMAINWSGEEWESHRRLVQFWRRQDSNDIQCSFAPVAPSERQPNSIVISCIYWAEKNDCFLTSVDCIYLLESLIAVRFTVEEKNRIRRNLEGFRPITVSKCKPESAEFFKLIMSFPNPKPRNIEKDVKVFPYALKKIIGKYTASYSSTASIQTEAFHNANFPHGSTLPLTPQQQSIIEASMMV